PERGVAERLRHELGLAVAVDDERRGTTADAHEGRPRVVLGRAVEARVGGGDLYVVAMQARLRRLLADAKDVLPRGDLRARLADELAVAQHPHLDVGRGGR